MDEYNDAASSSSSSSLAVQQLIARGLGYLIGFGSLMLYTPIAIRVCRQQRADGLVLSTWWLKLSSYLLSDMYYVRKGYELSTWAETLIITIEAAVVLGLVAFYQEHAKTPAFWCALVALLAAAVYGFTLCPEAVVATGQLTTVLLGAVSLLPQFWQNYARRSSGDYSPVTAGLATTGCVVRIFTTLTLNDGDPVLMLTFVSATLLNGALLGQIIYYGTRVEGLTLSQVLLSDVVTANHQHTSADEDQVGGGSGAPYGGLVDESDRQTDVRLVPQPQESANWRGASASPTRRHSPSQSAAPVSDFKSLASANTSHDATLIDRDNQGNRSGDLV